MKRTLLILVILVAGCRRASTPPAAGPRDAGLPLSHGFEHQIPPAGPPEPEKDTPLPRNPTEFEVPAELKGRPVPASGLALYVDGKLRRNVPADELKQPVVLDRVIGTIPGLRSVLVHADQANLWIRAGALGGYRVKLNRRGLIKLEAFAPQPGGGGDDDEGGGNDQKDPGLRGVQWIEARTDKSARLAGEP